MAIRLQLPPITFAQIIEAPYALADGRVKIIPMAADDPRFSGYDLYMSYDGITYFWLTSVEMFQIAGRLLADYPITRAIDDQVGVSIAILAGDADRMETITRAQAMTGFNMALVGDEIISVQTVTPVSDDEYLLTGVFRGRLDSVRKPHKAGEMFWFLGRRAYVLIEDTEFHYGAERWFKMVPRGPGGVGDISQAQACKHSFTCRARTPLMPGNLRANGKARQAEYTGDIVLTWSPRVRGDGAGVGSADVVTDTDSNAWEGLFRVEVWGWGSLVATYSAISAATWTYTQAQTQSDFGGLPSRITLKVSNYSLDRSYTYESEQAEIEVRNWDGTTTTTTTATTTTTTA